MEDYCKFKDNRVFPILFTNLVNLSKFGAGTPRPISIQNQVADSFQAFVGCIVAHFVTQMSLLRE